MSKPPVSKVEGPQFASTDARLSHGLSFSEELETYDAVRPGYPDAVCELLEPVPADGWVTDIGAGTGKLTESLCLAGYRVCATDPSAQMLRQLKHKLPDVAVWQSIAENTALAEASVHTITCAQTWHWVNGELASAECDRIAVPDGQLLLAWNTLDVREPWVHRLTRIMHAGDVHRPGFVPVIAAPWRIKKELRTTWKQVLTPEQIILLAHTRSYWQKSPEHIRARVETNLRWYLYEHLGFTPGEPVSLPYRCDAFLATRSLP